MDQIQMGEGPHWNRGPQLAAIRAAAARVDIADGVALDGWLALSLGELRALKERIADETRDWGRVRPHGVFISTFDRIENGWLFPGRTEIPPIEVEGTLSIFGEGDSGHRPPYLVIGLVTKDTPESRTAAIVRAYAHPCVWWSRLTLLDSGLERDSLDQILNCRKWLFDTFKISMIVTKPLFDVGPVDTDAPRKPCLPDFVIRAMGSGVEHPTIVIETMGYADDTYRERKRRLRPLFEAVDRPPGASPTPVIEHDRFRADLPGDPDRRFWNELRWTVTKLSSR
ncbi:hypothetical protein [Tardiphaga sp. 367_B4_N1_1]|uniref:hypothetical protein n=1 Tax=Tardiphaga sp. 367_B4_N1_1 TaxID=3240777 RepID=UPI003F1FBF3A